MQGRAMGTVITVRQLLHAFGLREQSSSQTALVRRAISRVGALQELEPMAASRAWPAYRLAP